MAHYFLLTVRKDGPCILTACTEGFPSAVDALSTACADLAELFGFGNGNIQSAHLRQDDEAWIIGDNFTAMVIPESMLLQMLDAGPDFVEFHAVTARAKQRDRLQ